MKKIIFIFFCIIIPFTVNAQANQNIIKEYYIDATVTENGDLKVQELIVVDGNFNYFKKNLEYQDLNLKDYETGDNSYLNSSIYNAEGIRNVKLYVKPMEKDETIDFKSSDQIFIELKQVLNKKKATKGNYFMNYLSTGREYTMYYSNDSHPVLFLLEYEIEKAVVIHEDTAELNWTFIRKDFDFEIADLNIKVNLPNKEAKNIYFWFHGDINGTIEQNEDKSIITKIKRVSKNVDIDNRILFPKEDLKTSNLRHSKQFALDTILEIETKNNEIMQTERKVTHMMINSVKSTSITYLFFLFLLWIYVYFRYDREHHIVLDTEITSEIVYDYNIEVIDYIFKKDVKRRALASSLLNLISKNNLDIKKVKDKYGKVDYEIKFLNNKLSNYTEDYLLNMLFPRMNKRKQVRLSQIKRKALSKKSYKSFYSHVEDWLLCAYKDGIKNQFYESNGVAIVSAVLMFTMAVIQLFVAIYYSLNFILSYLLLPAAITYLFYTLTLKKRSKKGHKNYLHWQNFQRYLVHFNQLDEQTLPKTSEIEKIFVYSTIFGLNADLLKDIRIKGYAKKTIEELNLYNDFFAKVVDLLEENEQMMKKMEMIKNKK